MSSDFVFVFVFGVDLVFSLPVLDIFASCVDSLCLFLQHGGIYLLCALHFHPPEIRKMKNEF